MEASVLYKATEDNFTTYKGYPFLNGIEEGQDF
jgi:hypothetical protein